jgi:hypothetical protein
MIELFCKLVLFFANAIPSRLMGRHESSRSIFGDFSAYLLIPCCVKRPSDSIQDEVRSILWNYQLPKFVPSFGTISYP